MQIHARVYVMLVRVYMSCFKWRILFSCCCCSVVVADFFLFIFYFNFNMNLISVCDVHTRTVLCYMRVFTSAADTCCCWRKITTSRRFLLLIADYTPDIFHGLFDFEAKMLQEYCIVWISGFKTKSQQSAEDKTTNTF